MLQRIRCLLGVLFVLCTCVCTLPGQEKEKDDLADNPLFKGWAEFKVGSTATHREKVRYEGDSPDGKFYPDGIDQKDVTYKLLKVDEKKVIVQTVVKDYEFLSSVESAATKITYPAKVKKAYLEAAREKLGVKEGEEEIEVLGKKYKAKWLEYVTKTEGESTTHKVWRNNEVPGGVLKRTNITKKGDKVTAEGHIDLLRFKAE